MYSLHTHKSTDELENIALNFITKVIFDKQILRKKTHTFLCWKLCDFVISV